MLHFFLSVFIFNVMFENSYQHYCELWTDHRLPSSSFYNPTLTFPSQLCILLLNPLTLLSAVGRCMGTGHLLGHGKPTRDCIPGTASPHPHSSNHHLAIAPQLGLGFLDLLGHPCSTLAGLVLHRSCAYSHHHREFMCAVSNTESTVSQHSFATSGSYNLYAHPTPPFSMIPES